ncbi:MULTISPECIES: FecCD family ABC transporter permease [Enterococcus]|uniref:FecCD family ABC transporter permease n=1 Tax=Enterococcus TaxID=1350 RepID=UPI00033110CC|nr:MULTISPECIES: iron ABC transporter permease [Enterococcus]EGO2585323.1 iron ABC transporter permease [Enterococcus faecalis]EGO2590838.1 iron ABC transporter permease [Enterococcus faecalis]EGO2665809.1 iron ABC transporter permease [Enterococcus faecalis]EGO2815899.1 iron ABC transporter permease [Enterococcus faecalis]EGO2834805.1 iron ABC transporter permease [Enterococcus faecalis]
MITNKYCYLWVSLILFLLISIAFSLKIGSVSISFYEIKELLEGGFTTNKNIFFNIRLPRVFFSVISGINLALSGLFLQIVLKNPMADPGILGISSGSALGATVVMLLLPVSVALVPLVAFLGGMVSFFIILLFAWEKSLSPTRLVLSGVAVNAIIGGLQSVLMITYSDKLQGVITWLNGDLSGKTWEQVEMILIYSLPIIILSIFMIDKMNILNLPDRTIYSLGVNVRQNRVIVASIAVFLAGITVSQVGLISFVGLIVPQIGKILVGGNMRKLFPCVMLIGSIVVTIADLLARSIISPLEIPIGTVMSVLGGPFFLFLLSKQKRG